ncbi:MATE family efflux transporter [Shinella sp. G-2]|uniref:MATE family efflux transporter n=1 Tax=Shinella sp. G-2 TaxID=3133141 RepID=UPI003D07ADDC
MSHDRPHSNPFLSAPLGALFLKTAAPIVFVMSMNGLLTVMDAVMLGLYVGPQAVAAVTAVFPLFMLLVAVATLVGSGMASGLARALGGSDLASARTIFATAHWLALAVSAAFIAGFLAVGHLLVAGIANGAPGLGDMAYAYMSIVAVFSPVQLLLAINVDALRCEGRAGLMAVASLAISLANLLFNVLLIVRFDMGVAGSAFGTVLAQGLALSGLALFRASGRTPLRLKDALAWPPAFRQAARAILALGAPQSLGFIGLALVSAAVIAALHYSAGGAYATLVSAYGIVTRILTFAYLPLLGMSQAVQVILGQNRGAGLRRRADDTLRLGLMTVLAYCLLVEIALAVFPADIGALFVGDAAVIAAVARIMPVMTALYVLSGPLMVIGGYFQATGDARRAAVLGLAKPYLFTLPLVAGLTARLGEGGLWYAMPAADLLLFALTLAVLRQTARRHGLRWRLFARDPA